MVLVWPVGVLAMYAALLHKNRARIGRPEAERELDEGIKTTAFLWEPYRPSYWWFEIFETARRLAVTGVLGAISPGTDAQLAAGIVLTFACTMAYVGCRPFVELKDNALGVLTNAQIFLVLLWALVMTWGGVGGGGLGGEAEDGIGALLICLQALVFAVFLVFGAVQCRAYKSDGDAGKHSEAGLALGVLKKSAKSGLAGGGGGAGAGVGRGSGGRARPAADAAPHGVGQTPMAAAGGARGGAQY
jgi:hypothetical protein